MRSINSLERSNGSTLRVLTYVTDKQTHATKCIRSCYAVDKHVCIAIGIFIVQPVGTNDTRHEKTDIKVFVDVIPKEGRWLRPSFFWYDNDKDLNVCFLVTCVIY